MNCAIGDTVARGTVLLEVYGNAAPIEEEALLRGIVLAAERSLARDANYPIGCWSTRP